MRSKWRPAKRRRGRRTGFTIIELLVAATLLILILTMTGSIISSSSRAWRQANAKIDSFQTARTAFDSLTARLSRATLNTYWDYYSASGEAYRLVSAPANFVPGQYGRYSDLHFLCGQASALVGALPPGFSAVSTQAIFFIAPTGLSADANYRGLSGLLGACGYFVAYGNDDATRPTFPPIASRYRWRLMEVSAPVEELSVFDSNSGKAWATTPVGAGRVRSVAENVIALIVWPKLSAQDDVEGDDISNNYNYDSRTTAAWTGNPLRQPVQAHQLPPNVQVTMVVMDEESAMRLEAAGDQEGVIQTALSGLFSTTVSAYAADLDSLERRLADKNIGFRVFSTTVALRDSKWSP